MQQYRLNVGLLIGLIVATLVLSVVIFGVHRFQLSRNAEALIAAGEKSQQEGDLKSAIREYSNYLSIRPDDTDVRVKLANLWIDFTEQPGIEPEDIGRALGYLEEVVRQMPDQKDLQKRLVDLYGRINGTQQALDHLSHMLEKFPDDPKLHVEQMQYLLRTRKLDGPDGALAKSKRLIGYDDKTDSFDVKKAIAPHDPTAYTNCAMILRSVQNKPELADRVMDELVKQNPELAAAYLQRGQYFVGIGEPQRGQRDIEKAYKLAPTDPDVLLMMASRADANKRAEQARQYLDAGLKSHPEDTRFYQGLASLEMKDKQYDKALAIIADGLKAVPKEKTNDLLFYRTELQFMANDLDGIDRSVADMTKAGFPDEFIHWVEARKLLAQAKYYEASEALAKLKPQLGSAPMYADSIGYQLGLAYEKSGQIDKADAEYKSVLDRNPANEPAKAGRQRLAAMSGRPEKNPRTGDLDEAVAKILQQPKEARDWTKVDADLAKLAEERELKGAALDLFWARMMLAREDYAEARKRLVAGRGKDPDNLEIQRLAVALLRTDPTQSPEKALRLLDQIVENFGDKPDLRLDRADCLIAANLKNRNDAQLKQQLAELQKLPDDWTPAQKIAFWNGLAGRYLALGLRDEATLALNEVAKLQPNELQTRVALFGLALEANDDVAMKEAQDQILRIVGSKEDSNWLYSEARRQLSLYRRGQLNKEALADIKKLTNRALAERPNWFELQLVSAEIALLEGDEKEALARFEKAQELGRPNGAAVIQHVRLLLAEGKYAAAKRLIDQLPPGVREGDLGQIYAEVLMSTGDYLQATEVIAKYAEAAPNAADRQLVMGQILTRASNAPNLTDDQRKDLMAKAGPALEKAVEFSPESPQTWLALLTYQIVQQDVEAAKQTLQRAQLGLAEDQLAAVLAKGNEIMGQWFNAENVYLTALEAQPENLPLAQELAAFYLSQAYPRPDKFAKATPLVNRILHAGADGKLPESDASVMWARRAAAQMLAATNDYQNLLKAEKLLASNTKDGELPAQDRLQMAEILSARPDPISRRKAKVLFEQVKSDQPLTLKDDMILGQLYFALGEWENCKRHMQLTVARNKKSVEARAQYLNMILQRGTQKDIDSAVRQVQELREIAPNDLRTVQLMAEIGAKTGQEQKVRQYLVSLLPKVTDPKQLTEPQVAMMEFVASMLVRLKAYDEAEQVYRAIVARDPNKILALADFVGAHRDVDQSVKLLEGVYKPELTEPVSRVGIAVVRARRDEIGEKYDSLVQGWLDRGLRENPDSVPLLMLQAEFDDVKKDYDSAAEIYKKLLARKDVTGITRAIVLNNLAFLVALAGNESEAGVDPLKLVQEATQILGPTADILDTEAVIYTTKGEYAKAIADLENSLTDNPTAAKYFHKAVAHLGAGQNTAAVKAWDDAHKLDKNVRESLNRMEFESYDKTKATIDQLRNQSQSLTRAAG